MIPRELALRAAEMLEREATDLRQAHTIKGEWPAEEFVTEVEYHEMMSVALELRRHCDGS